MIDRCCLCYDGDKDCDRCVKHGYIYTCAGCEDAVYVTAKPYKEEQENNEVPTIIQADKEETNGDTHLPWNEC